MRVFLAARAGEPLSMETHPGAGWSPSVLDEVRAMGVEVREVPRMAAFGRIHGIRWFAEAGEWEGVADPDWEGTALGPRPQEQLTIRQE
jgi:gamma-glutamyltranspeptidase